jgi:metal-responsive CopG/Arc/MetJ family transcriptional regulator
MISMRLPKAEIASLDKWAKAQSCTRSEAIRRLIRKIKA